MIHIIPVGDDAEHLVHQGCPCIPELVDLVDDDIVRQAWHHRTGQLPPGATIVHDLVAATPGATFVPATSGTPSTTCGLGGDSRLDWTQDLRDGYTEAEVAGGRPLLNR